MRKGARTKKVNRQNRRKNELQKNVLRPERVPGISNVRPDTSDTGETALLPEPADAFIIRRMSEKCKKCRIRRVFTREGWTPVFWGRNRKETVRKLSCTVVRIYV